MAIQSKLNSIDRGYVGDKPEPKAWADLIEEDEDFKEEFQRLFNDDAVSIRSAQALGSGLSPIYPLSMEFNLD